MLEHLGIDVYEFRYDTLLELTYRQTAEIVSSCNEFVLVADAATSERIERLLENERRYAGSKRSLVDRLRYIVGCMPGFRTAKFIPLMQRIRADGFVLNGVSREESRCRLVFVKA